MKLRGQLLIAAALIALLPLTALLFLNPIERLLRAGHEQAVAESAATAAALLTARGLVPPPPPGGGFSHPVLYRHPVATRRLLDGYADDWHASIDRVVGLDGAGGAGATVHQRPSDALDDGRDAVRIAALDDGTVMDLYLRVRDDDPVYADSDGQPGDAITIRLEGLDGTTRLRFAPAAPGPLALRDRFGRLVRARWQDRADGWSLELRVPVDPGWTTAAFDVVDRGPAGDVQAEYASGPLRLLRPDVAISAALAALSLGPAWMTEPGGWVVARAPDEIAESTEPPAEPAGIDPGPGVFDFLMAARVERAEPWTVGSAQLTGPELRAAETGEPTSGWWRVGDERSIRLRFAMPLNGVPPSRLLVLERDAGPLLLLANRAVLSWLGASLLVFMAVALVLFAFVLVLSIRVRRLRNAAERAVERGGRVGELPVASAAADELGDLSRSLRSLMERLREHQRYLQTLADKLAHELRTPVSMVQSSLDNLHAERDAARAGDYLRRAEQGAARLRRIVQAMSQAARLEDSLTAETLRDVDLGALVADYASARRDALPDRRWTWRVPDRGVARVLGSEDLLAQLLDKLVDNAVDFSPDGGRIELRVEPSGGGWRLAVENEGPRIAADRRAAMFDSMVSYRDVRDDAPHLGLGLYVARCIADYHGASIDAGPTDRGTVVEVVFEVEPGQSSRGQAPGQ